MKTTKARRDIKNIIQSTTVPLSAEQVFNLLNGEYDLSTIYRNLNYFSNKSEINSLVFSDKITYYYPAEGHYHYIYCIKCKSFKKIEMCFEAELTNFIEKNLGYEIVNHVLYFEGLCPDCHKK